LIKGSLKEWLLKYGSNIASCLNEAKDRLLHFDNKGEGGGFDAYEWEEYRYVS
jgi:hypothetical protein